MDTVATQQVSGGASIRAVERFTSHDGTRLAYRREGSGPLLVCLPGGPGQASAYLGDLGGLSARRTLVVLENRGVPPSAMPDDLGTLRVDRLVEDVEALRRHLGVPRMDLLGHSAAGGVAMLYAARHPARLGRLVLANPSLRVVGLPSDVGVDDVAAERSGEAWHDGAVRALQASQRADSYDEAWSYWLPAARLSYGRWTDAARAHATATPDQFSRVAQDGFYAGFEPEPAVIQRLAALDAPVLIIGGEHDLWPTRLALEALTASLPTAELFLQPGAGHFPWVDDAHGFVRTVGAFLGCAAT